MKLVFLDTETTGIMPEDRLCQIAYKLDGKLKCELFKPPLPIKIDAMAVHHITQKMVGVKPPFQDSPLFEELRDLLEGDDAVLVAHNARFDAVMLRHEGIISKKIICTLKVARHLDMDAVIPRYSLQYLRYYHNLDIDAVAHDAAGDVLVLEGLYHLLAEEMKREFGADSDIIQEMMKISAQPSLMRRINFGKHSGKLLLDVLKEDRSYLEWLLLQKQDQPQEEEDWIYSLKYYLSL
jgi:exodeoxyribonuclease X